MRLGTDYVHDFAWREKLLRVGFLRPEARTKISEGFNYMSRETIRHRFFGLKNGFTDRELKYLTEIDGYNHFALGVEERQTPERGIAIARMVRDDLEPTEAEIALLIIDDYQRAGLGTLLMQLCLIAAHERGITKLRFTYLPDNTGIVKLIKRFGHGRAEFLASDYMQMKIPVEKARVDAILETLRDFIPTKKERDP